MEEEGQVGVTLVESEAEEAILERASDRTKEVAGNIELELPDALQDLLRRLSGVLRSDENAVTEIPDLGDHKYGDFFQGDGQSGTRLEVRLKVLEAVGKCKTLRTFDNYLLLSYYELSLIEWEAILIPMQNNLELEKIVWYSLGSAQIEEEIGSLLHDLFAHAHNLASLSLSSLGGERVRAKLVAAIASGLRVNGLHRLQKLFVQNSTKEKCDDDATVVKHVADIISLAPELSELILQGEFQIDGNAREDLTAALRACFNLRRLSMYNVQGEGIPDVVAEVYGRTCPRPFLESLRLWDVEGLTVDVLALLTGSNILEIDVSVSSKHMSYFNMGEWQSIGKGFLEPLTLSTFHISVQLRELSNEELQKLEKGLGELWKVSEESPILNILVAATFDDRIPEDKRIVPEASHDQLIFLENAVKDTYLRTIDLQECDVSLSAFESFLGKLAPNTSVRNLRFWYCKRTSREDGWAYLFRHLRDNTSITFLSLSHCNDLTSENFKELMDLLQVNFTLQQVKFKDTEWAREGKDALVEEVLQRNKKLAGYFSILGEAKLPFGRAKAGRIFMCGAPYAGKTQLKVTMMKTLEKDSKSESLTSAVKQKLGQTIAKLRVKRTEGIEVELLCDDPSCTISIWDFAGQEIFRALQNILFPKINQACIFVFAFNPLEEDGKRLKERLNHVFVEELGSWLRFVVSNTSITGRILPQFFIIVTHMDTLKKRGIIFDLVSQQLENAVKHFQVKFQDVVDISPRGFSDSNRCIYYLNATNQNDVEPITNLVISSMRDVLAKKSSKVPIVCSELVSSILKRPKDVQLEPLWSAERFYKFCSDSHPLLQSFKLMDKKGKGVLRAVASYLHDAGAICMTPSTFVDSDDNSVDNLKKLTVVDLNWLTQNLLGQLISIGHGFEGGDGGSTSQESHSTLQKPGFINDQQLTKLIERILHGKRKHVDYGMVRELLLELDFCYSLESAPGLTEYFMPIIFSGGQGTSKAASMSKLKWSIEPEEASDHFGYRVECQDNERTSFSPALFPRYQIHLRKEMEANHGVIDENFIFSLSFVEIRVGGCWILVEIDESRRNHIDILVKVSKLKTRDWAMSFVQKHIVKGFSEFCASEKGCPGMQVVVAVLRTDCVKKLTPRELRKKCQSMLLGELKRKFQKDVEDQLQDGKTDRELMFDYIHHWPEISKPDYPEFELPPDAEPAENLLSSGEVNDVVAAVQRKYEQLWPNLEELREVSNRLGNAYKEYQCLLLSATGDENSSLEEFSFKREHKTQFLGPLVSGSSFRQRGDVSVGEKLILQGMHELQENMIAGFAQVREDFRHLKSSLKELHSRMSQVNSTLDSIIRFKISEEKHRYPRRPYFSPDVSLSQKVKAKVVFARAVRLHLMCEARHGPHFVKDQPGLKLLLKEEGQFAEWMRTLSVISLHMIWILLKIGVQVTAGSGSAVPEISNLGTRISVGTSAAAVNVVLDQLKVEVVKNVNMVKNERSVEEAWCGLRNYLEPLLTSGECARNFSLHLVRYKNSDDPYAWLCESCMSSARRNFLLE